MTQLITYKDRLIEVNDHFPHFIYTAKRWHYAVRPERLHEVYVLIDAEEFKKKLEAIIDE